MIVDVHTHAPRHKTPPPEMHSKLSGLWRPDQSASTAHTWDDYIKGVEPVDRAIVFNIASDPREAVPETAADLPDPGRQRRHRRLRSRLPRQVHRLPDAPPARSRSTRRDRPRDRRPGAEGDQVRAELPELRPARRGSLPGLPSRRRAGTTDPASTRAPRRCNSPTSTTPTRATSTAWR